MVLQQRVRIAPHLGHSDGTFFPPKADIDGGHLERCSNNIVAFGQRCVHATDITVNDAMATPGDLMQSAVRQAAAGQTSIELGHPEGQHGLHAAAMAFDLFDLRAQASMAG